MIYKKYKGVIPFSVGDIVEFEDITYEHKKVVRRGVVRRIDEFKDGYNLHLKCEHPEPFIAAAVVYPLKQEVRLVQEDKQMNGVEILNETQVVAESAFNWITFWILSGIIVGLFIIICIMFSIFYGLDLQGWVAIMLAGIFLALVAGVMCGAGNSIPTKYETHYQVTIDDSVSMTDFLEKYEIIDTEGKIITVRERDQ